MRWRIRGTRGVAVAEMARAAVAHRLNVAPWTPHRASNWQTTPAEPNWRQNALALAAKDLFDSLDSQREPLGAIDHLLAADRLWESVLGT